MIFPTLEERDRVINMIAERQMFNDISQERRATIYGLYYAISEIESMRDEEGYEPEVSPTMQQIVNEVQEAAFNKAVERLEGAIAELYVSFKEAEGVKEE